MAGTRFYNLREAAKLLGTGSYSVLQECLNDPEDKSEYFPIAYKGNAWKIPVGELVFFLEKQHHRWPNSHYPCELLGDFLELNKESLVRFIRTHRKTPSVHGGDIR